MQKNLQKTRITLDELTGHLREKDVLDPRSVQYAILETNGNLSVFPYPKEKPASANDAGIPVKAQHLPITIISDGHLLKENMRFARKDYAWLHHILAQRNSAIEDTWLLTVDDQDHILWYSMEDSQ